MDLGISIVKTNESTEGLFSWLFGPGDPKITARDQEKLLKIFDFLMSKKPDPNKLGSTTVFVPPLSQLLPWYAKHIQHCVRATEICKKGIDMSDEEFDNFSNKEAQKIHLDTDDDLKYENVLIQKSGYLNRSLIVKAFSNSNQFEKTLSAYQNVWMSLSEKKRDYAALNGLDYDFERERYENVNIAVFLAKRILPKLATITGTTKDDLKQFSHENLYVSTEQLFSDLVELNEYCGQCDALNRLSSELILTLRNIRDIARTIKRHPSIESIATIESIFSGLKGGMSYETLKEKGRAVLDKIIAGFTRVANALKGLWERLLKMLPTVRNRLDALLNRIVNLDPTKFEIGAWEYHGFDVLAANKVNKVWDAISSLKEKVLHLAYEDNSTKADVISLITSAIGVEVGDYRVVGISDTTKVVKNTIYFVDEMRKPISLDKAYLKRAEREFKEARRTPGADVGTYMKLLKYAMFDLELSERLHYGCLKMAVSILANCKITKKGEAK